MSSSLSGVASLPLGAPSGALTMWMEEWQAGLRPRRGVYLAVLEGERRRYIAPAIPPAQACVLCRAGAVAQVPSKRSLPYSSSLIQCSIVQPPVSTHLPGPFIHRIRKRHVEKRQEKKTPILMRYAVSLPILRLVHDQLLPQAPLNHPTSPAPCQPLLASTPLPFCGTTARVP